MATHETRLRVPWFDLAISVKARDPERLRRTVAYRYVLGPARNILGRRHAQANGHWPGGVSAVPPSDAAPANATIEARDLFRRCGELTWYHTIDLPGGIATPGFIDHRAQVPLYGLPDDMTGMRALDVATFDGFWAFEMERRGADVVAIDIARSSDADIPLRWKERLGPEADVATGAGFRLAAEALGSRVDRRLVSVYELDPAELGTFDLVLVSDLLQHLRDPQRALERVFTVTRPDGRAILAEVYAPELERHDGVALTRFEAFAGYTWSIPSVASLKRMMNVAGFGALEELSRFELAHGDRAASKIVLRGTPWRPKDGRR